MIHRTPSIGDTTEWMDEFQDFHTNAPILNEPNPTRVTEILGADGNPIRVDVPRRAMGFDLTSREVAK